MKQILSFLLFSLCAYSAAQAQLIGVQFFSTGAGGDPTALTSTTEAGVLPQENFNVITVPVSESVSSFSASNLLTSTGLNSHVSLAVVNKGDSNDTGSNASSSVVGTPNAILVSSQIGDYNNPTPATFTLSGLAPGEYNLVVYTLTTANLTGEASLTEGTASQPNYFFDEQNGTDFNGTFIQSTATTLGAVTTPSNYVEFVDVSPDASGEIEFAMTPQSEPGGVSSVSAIQLEEVPEPSTLLLMGLAAFLLPAITRARRFIISS